MGLTIERVMIVAKEQSKRITLRIHPDIHARAQFWAERGGISVNEYVMEAIEQKIERDNGLIADGGTLMDRRMGQLIDGLKSMESRVGNMEVVTTRGFEMLTQLARGDNFLLDDDTATFG